MDRRITLPENGQQCALLANARHAALEEPTCFATGRSGRWISACFVIMDRKGACESMS
jgi:hypothetical protein